MADPQYVTYHVPIQLTSDQLLLIQGYLNSKNYPAMYQAIAGFIQGTADPDTQTWYNTASLINSSVFNPIGDVARQYVAAMVKTETGDTIQPYGTEFQQASNALAIKVGTEILQNGSVPPAFTIASDATPGPNTPVTGVAITDTQVAAQNIAQYLPPGANLDQYVWPGYADQLAGVVGLNSFSPAAHNAIYQSGIIIDNANNIINSSYTALFNTLNDTISSGFSTDSQNYLQIYNNYMSALVNASPQGSSVAALTSGSDGWSIDYATASGSEITIGSAHVASPYPSGGNYVLQDGTTIPASAVTSISYNNRNAGIGINFGVGESGTPNGAGLSVVQGNGNATVTDFDTGNQIKVSGTVDTNNLQAGQSLAVTTAAGTYHVDPTTGDITDAVTSNAVVGGNTVKIITPKTPDSVGIIPPSFAVIQSTDASASSSIVTLSTHRASEWRAVMAGSSCPYGLAIVQRRKCLHRFLPNAGRSSHSQFGKPGVVPGWR